MSQSVVFTFIGRDQPGLVEKLSTTVADHGGNWLESRMSQLSGQFAGVVRVAVAPEQQESLRQALEALSSHGLTIVSQASDEDSTTDSGVFLHIVGNDRPGIVREVSRALARHQINVIDMHTEITSAPMTGEALFEASAEIQVPEGVDRDELEDALEAISEQLSVEIDLK
ncbi:glycine cleavage system regulatory protein [Litorivivens lipolytica]|uniref:Glycine cleavage system transcriptional repressor n=1 Tax=Litorivivens lipolytica TaxID=1524264 RepID=A0A7W4W3D1_9GAMM|nr:glycine cleavage system regulatory protein [Litorivivens lipolytica]